MAGGRVRAGRGCTAVTGGIDCLAEGASLSPSDPLQLCGMALSLILQFALGNIPVPVSPVGLDLGLELQ
eukprot:12257092-Alexandrium_andersonii.AAC.1